MKRTESPVVDYDSDPVLKQIKAKFDKTEEEKEKLRERAIEFCSSLQPFLNDKLALESVLMLEKEVVDRSSDPEKVEVNAVVHFLLDFENAISNIRENAKGLVLEHNVFIEIIRFRSMLLDIIVRIWKERHPLLDITVEDYRLQFVRITRKTPPSLE